MSFFARGGVTFLGMLTAADLRDAALAHLARYNTSRLGLTQALHRHIERWGSRQDPPVPDLVAEARSLARDVVASLAAAGLVDDAGFAATRVRTLVRAGRSRAAVAAHLAARGVTAEIVQDTLPEDPETELAAALAVARRRRIGPFRRGGGGDDLLRRELAVLARAGFPRDVAARALHMNADEAATLVFRLRRP